MNINEYLELTREVAKDLPFEFVNIRPRIVCANGFDVSIQASENMCCRPRDNKGPYSEVEIGYPSEQVDEWMEYAEEPDEPTSTFYGYVPVEVVDEVLRKHGGIANGVAR